MEPIVGSQVRHLYEVERLSIRQIAKKLRMARKTVGRVVRNERVMRSYPDSILRSYERLIDQWYQEYPFLRASQVYERSCLPKSRPMPSFKSSPDGPRLLPPS